MVARGHLLVAAVGNDGPAAPPLYPASYPGVVGVTGVDRQGRPLPEAAQGPQVMFAAPGSQMVSAAPGRPPYRQVRGTSFAAPLVAALLSTRLPQPDRQGAAQAIAARLDTGTVWINDHNRLFAEAETGGYRRSGIGRLHGYEGLADFLETKHIYRNAGLV
jgi:subtilisin family serine protease